jgi:hypothetical protein
MLFPKEYVGYLARQVTQKLAERDAELIHRSIAHVIEELKLRV